MVLSRERVRALVGIIAVGLVVMGLGVTTGGPVNATPVSAAEPKRPLITERPDAVSAVVTARAQGQRVEDLSQRTATTQVFANPDGSRTSESAAAPVRAQDREGRWSDIDPTLEPVDGGFAPKSAMGGLVISGGGTQSFAHMNVDGRELEWDWPTALPTPSVTGDTATYANVVENGDLVVTATPSGFRHDIVLRKAPSNPLAFHIPVVTSGPKLTEAPTGQLSVKTRSGGRLVSAAPPVMYDAPDPTTGASAHQAPVGTTVTRTPTGAVMTLDPSEKFLNDPTVTYPVTIDPTFSSTNPDDTWVSNTGPNSVHPGDSTLNVGTPDAGATKYRSYIRFNGNTTPWAGASVSSATFTLRNYNSSGSTCTGAAVAVRRIGGPWDPGSATWNNPPGSTTTNEALSTARKGGSTGCAAGDVSWNVTAIAQDWANGSPNYGLAVRGYDETKTATYRQYRAAGTYNPPFLTVSYNHSPGTPTSLALSPVRGTSTNSAVPTLSASVSDPDGGQITAAFHLRNSAGTEIWSASQPVPLSGAWGTASVQVPKDLLEEGSSYSFTVDTSDGSLPSGSSVAKSFNFNPMSTVVPAPQCVAPCTTVTDAGLVPDGTVLQAGQSVMVTIAAPEISDPLDVDQALLRLSAKNWTTAGSLLVADPDYPTSESPTLSFGTSGDPSVGVETTLAALPSLDGNQVRLTNNSSAQVTVALHIYAWVPWVTQDEEDLIYDESLDAADLNSDASYVAADSTVLDRTVVVPRGAQLDFVNDPNGTQSVPEENPIACPDDGAGGTCSYTMTPADPSEALSNTDYTDDTSAVMSNFGEAQTATAISSAEQQCLRSSDTAGWVYTSRYHACSAWYVHVTIWRWNNGAKQVIGNAGLKMHMLAATHRSPADVDVKAKMTYVDVANTGVAGTLEPGGQFFCGDACSDSASNLTYHLAISKASPDTGWYWNWTAHVPLTPGQYRQMGVGFRYHAFASGVKTTWESHYGSLIRCDNMAYLPSAGCVMQTFPPTFKQHMDPETLGHQTANHMGYAQVLLSGNPGSADAGHPLTRKYWGPGVPSANRREALRKCRAEGIASSCDEYPFSSSNQGCFFRTCSVEQVDVADNREQGRLLGRFYAQQRVMDGDAYYTQAIW